MYLKKHLMLLLSLILLIVPEPSVFAAVFFQDNFESGNLSYSESDTHWGGSSHGPEDLVEVSNDRAHSGSYSLKFHYEGGPSGDDAWAEQRFVFGNNKTNFYIRFYIYFPSNFTVRNDSPNNNKAIVVWGDNYSSKGAQGQEFTANAFVPKAHKVWVGGGWELSCDGGFGNIESIDGIGHWSMSNLTLRQWICFEYHFKADSGSGDGAMEFWVDGVKQYGGTNLTWIGATCSPSYFNAGYLLGWANSGYAEDTDIFIDDVVFSDSYIGPSGESPGELPGRPGIFEEVPQ